MARRNRSLLLIAPLLLAGCGGAEAPTPDERAVAQALEQYLTAVRQGDWPAACSMLTATLRADRARPFFGSNSCESFYALQASVYPVVPDTSHLARNDTLDTATPGEVNVRGENASVELRLPSPNEPILLHAHREAGQWRLSQDAMHFGIVAVLRKSHPGV